MSKVTVETRFTEREYKNNRFIHPINEYKFLIADRDVSLGTLANDIKDLECPKPNERFVRADIGIAHFMFETHGIHLHSTCRQNALIAASHVAFKNHYPLTLNPDIIWQAFSLGLSIHLNLNAKKFADKFDAKKCSTAIEINRKNFTYQHNNNDWETELNNIEDKVKENIGEELFNVFDSEFSTSTQMSRTSSHIALMGMLPNFFKYESYTLCGIPKIHLEGTPEDWIKMQEKVKGFLEIDPELGWWVEPAVELLDMFIRTSKGDVGEEVVTFWESWYKWKSLSNTQMVSGHIRTLFPYVFKGGKLARNERVDFRENGSVDFMFFPNCIFKAPIDWNFHNNKIRFYLITGLMSMTYTPEEGMKPIFGKVLQSDVYVKNI